ncbi:HAUS5 protein, partial [Uria aalge]|nr:HAUS5 protein [Uria aalge]
LCLPPPRLCSGPCPPIWDFVTRHVRHPRNVKKIRGNLLWYPLPPKIQRGDPKSCWGAPQKSLGALKLLRDTPK